MISRRGLLGTGAAMAFTPMGDRLPGGRRPDQHYQPPTAVTPAGGRQGVVRARQVIVSGPGEGMFSYSPTVGAGNLVASTGIAVAGTDPYGNAYLIGDTTYFQVSSSQWLALSDVGAGLSAFFATSEAGPWSGFGTFAPGYLNFATQKGPLFSLNTAFQVGNSIWLPPSGDSTGVTDAANITAAFGICQVVNLLQGQYKVNSTIVVPTGCALIGAFPTQADNFSNYSAGIIQAQGTVITPVGAFTNAAVVACQNSTVGVQQGGQVLANFSIQANTTGAGSGSMCVLLDGAVGAGYMTGITAIRGDAACLRIRSDVTTSHIPDQWTIENCTFAGSRSGHGVLADDMSDFNMVNCYSHDNALDGYNIRGGGNANWTACRAETNTGNGFHFTGFPSAGETMTFHGCMTELNKLSGFLFDATGFTNQGQYVLSGCSARADGQAASGILAGFYDDGSKCPVLLSGCSAITNGTGPAYGAYEGSVAFGMALTGCRSQGLTAATHDDGTNTNVLSNLVPVPF